MEELKSKLEEIANHLCLSDEEGFSPMESSGGNYDDAYSQGQHDGEIQLARTLLKFIERNQV
jgi:hypothetical protein